MTKAVQIAPSSSPDPSSLRGDWRKISSAQSLLEPTQYKHAHFIQISNIYFPSELLYSLNQAALGWRCFLPALFEGQQVLQQLELHTSKQG